MHPAVLLTVLLALREQQPLAAFVAAGSSFLYPPAALLAVGMLLVSAVAWRDGRPRVDRRRACFATLAVVVMLAAVLGPQLSGDNSPECDDGGSSAGVSGVQRAWAAALLSFLTGEVPQAGSEWVRPARVGAASSLAPRFCSWSSDRQTLATCG